MRGDAERGDDAGNGAGVSDRVGHRDVRTGLKGDIARRDEDRVARVTQTAHRAVEQRHASDLDARLVGAHANAAATAEHHPGERRRGVATIRVLAGVAQRLHCAQPYVKPGP